MSQPALQIADRYRLSLSDSWQEWFNNACDHIALPGSFRAPLSTDRLLADAPLEIWPGFMLPDTLPIISNHYGDWICARIEPDGSLGELVHWYHGGGDWIPVGGQIAEMVIHDVVDQFRPIDNQMLRGAPESTYPSQPARVLADFANPKLCQWLSDHLARGTAQPVQSVRLRLEQLVSLLANGDYVLALETLRHQHWAEDAVACDLIQIVLQESASPLAQGSIAQELAMNWTPDYVRLLFDIEQIPTEVQMRIMELMGPSIDSWPRQDWPRAESLAQEVLQRRTDLGWAVNIAGWSKQRSGDLQGAAQIYFVGRYASAFSDQAVRMRTHWVDSYMGKFTLAQLTQLSDCLAPVQRVDDYLQTVLNAPAKLTMQMVQEYWIHAARQQLERNAPAEAYACYYHAGWDMGAQRLSEYQRILEGLAHSARAAGWPARAAVAESHLACLKKRLGLVPK